MFDRRKSLGSSDPSAIAYASLKGAIAVELLESLWRQTPSRKRISARSAPNGSCSVTVRAREQVERLAESPLCIRAQASPERRQPRARPPRSRHVRTDLLELGDGLLVAVRLGERFGAG
jgi:hypothetical protein